MALYSYSRVQTFKQCPLKYRLRYIDRIRTVTTGIEAFMGSRVHDVLESLYRDVQMNRLPELSDVQALYESQWDSNWHDQIKITKKKYSARDYRQTGARCITDYYKRHHPFKEATTIGLEDRVLIKLSGPGPQFQGYIDRLAMVSDDYFEIHDYKTSASLPSQEKIDADEQLALYQIGIEQRWPHIKKVDLVWHYVALDSELRSSRSSEQLKALDRELRAAVAQIEEAEAAGRFDAVESALCGWCEYPQHCAVRRHHQTVGGLAATEFALDDGVKLVDTYAELEARRRAIKDEEAQKLESVEKRLEEVRRAAIDYAARIEANTLVGTGHELRVRTTERNKFPTKADPARTGLDSVVKEAGIWAEVADLNPSALERMIAAGDIGPELLKKIEPYLKKERSTKLSLSKSKAEKL